MEASRLESNVDVTDADWASLLPTYHHLKPKEKIGMPNHCSVAYDYGNDEFF